MATSVELQSSAFNIHRLFWSERPSFRAFIFSYSKKEWRNVLCECRDEPGMLENCFCSCNNSNFMFRTAAIRRKLITVVIMWLQCPSVSPSFWRVLSGGLFVQLSVALRIPSTTFSLQWFELNEESWMKNLTSVDYMHSNDTDSKTAWRFSAPGVNWKFEFFSRKAAFKLSVSARIFCFFSNFLQQSFKSVIPLPYSVKIFILGWFVWKFSWNFQPV